MSAKQTWEIFVHYCKTFVDNVQSMDKLLGVGASSSGGQHTLSPKIAQLTYQDLLPINADSYPQTKEFLTKVCEVLIDFIKQVSDRHEKILEFHHPGDLEKILDLELPDKPLPLEQLLQDCVTALKYQVKTGLRVE